MMLRRSAKAAKTDALVKTALKGLSEDRYGTADGCSQKTLD